MLATQPMPSSASTPAVSTPRLDQTCVLPVRKDSVSDVAELAGHLEGRARGAEVIVVDGSPPDVFAHHRRSFPGAVRHAAPRPEFHTPSGRVAGADDDVRYDEESLSQARRLDVADDVPADRIPTTFNAFVNTEIASDSRIRVMPPPASKASAFIEPRAEMDLIVGLTACSAELSNNWRFKPVEYEIVPPATASAPPSFANSGRRVEARKTGEQ
jgi:hypothetical protein